MLSLIKPSFFCSLLLSFASVCRRQERMSSPVRSYYNTQHYTRLVCLLLSGWHSFRSMTIHSCCMSCCLIFSVVFPYSKKWRTVFSFLFLIWLCIHIFIFIIMIVLQLSFQKNRAESSSEKNAAYNVKSDAMISIQNRDQHLFFPP